MFHSENDAWQELKCSRAVAAEALLDASASRCSLVWALPCRSTSPPVRLPSAPQESESILAPGFGNSGPEKNMLRGKRFRWWCTSCKVPGCSVTETQLSTDPAAPGCVTGVAARHRLQEQSDQQTSEGAPAARDLARACQKSAAAWIRAGRVPLANLSLENKETFTQDQGNLLNLCPKLRLGRQFVL